MQLVLISTSALSFPTMNQEDKLKDFKHTESGQTESSSSLDPSNLGPKSVQPESDVELEESENYPTKVILEALKSASPIIKEFLRPPVMNKSNSFGHQISKRDTDEEDDQRLCGVNRNIPFIPAAHPGDESLPSLPLNQTSSPDGLPQALQEFLTTSCKNPGLNGAVNFPGGFDTWCKQEYINLPVVALVPNTNTLVVKTLRVPTSCSCYLKP